MLEDGIYFGLPEEQYHDDPALGYTDHKALLVNAVQWQAKRLAGLAKRPIQRHQ